MNESTQVPDPLSFWETVNAYQRTAALRTGVELGLFTAIGKEAKSAGVLAGRCHASERGIRILCDYLVVVGLLEKAGNSYKLTLDSATFLDRNSSSYLGGMLPFLHSARTLTAFERLTEAVRTGRTALDGDGFVNHEDPIWVEFARSMPPIVMAATEFIAALTTQRFPDAKRVLDIAAGHGLFGIKIAQRGRGAEIVAQDWPNVLTVAQENARCAGIPDSRYHLLPGDAFEVVFPKSCDIVLLTNLLHHFDLKACGRLLDRIHACLNPNGVLITLEFIPNADRVSPPIPATFSLMMLGLTGSGDAYTFAELDQLLLSQGFTRNELLPVPGSPQHLVISHKQ